MKQVTCIKKRGSHYSPHERIERIGGDGWSESEAVAIGKIETGMEWYCTQVNGRVANLVVDIHMGRKYLKTENDRYAPDNLLSLPECP